MLYLSKSVQQQKFGLKNSILQKTTTTKNLLTEEAKNAKRETDGNRGKLVLCGILLARRYVSSHHQDLRGFKCNNELDSFFSK